MKKGFTLIELLVVISIIAILIAISVPILFGSRQTAKQLQCQKNFNQLNTIVSAYIADYKGLPFAHDVPSASPYPDGYPSPFKEYEQILKCPLGLRRYTNTTNIGNVEYFYKFGWKTTNGSQLLFPSNELYFQYNRDYLNCNPNDPPVLFMERDLPHGKKRWVLYMGENAPKLLTQQQERLPF
jgi:prepilin-type N-terminal cleavage/methylation domain-containing protein